MKETDDWGAALKPGAGSGAERSEDPKMRKMARK